jgi:CBS-domain-containing membrane protein
MKRVYRNTALRNRAERERSAQPPGALVRLRLRLAAEFQARRTVWRRAVIAGAGGGIATAIMVALAGWAGMPLYAVPFTTSIVLVMAAPESGAALPRSILGGHVLSALSGFAVLGLLGAWPGAAVGLSIALMLLTDTLHPPAGANGVIIVTSSAPWTFLFAPVITGALLLIAFAYIYHRLTRPGV